MQKRIEFNYNYNTKELYVSTTVPFEKANPDDLTEVTEEMLEKPTVLKALRLMGCNSFPQQLQQYVTCLYGGNDDKPDIDENGNVNPDYSHCGKRGNCKFEGLPGLCSLPIIDGKKLTRSDIDIAQRLTDGKIRKQIAAERFTSIHTVNAQIRKWCKNFGIRQAEIIKKSIKAGIVNF